MKNLKKVQDAMNLGILSLFISFIIDKSFLSLIVMMQYTPAIALFSMITFFGEGLSIIFLAIILSIFIVREKKRLLPLWATLGTVFFSTILMKAVFMRPRPFEAMYTESIVRTSLSSFPSGHTMAAFALIPFASMLWPKQSYIFWIIGILIGFSRIYLQVHYLSDVVAGALIGYTIAILFIHAGDKNGWK